MANVPDWLKDQFQEPELVDGQRKVKVPEKCVHKLHGWVSRDAALSWLQDIQAKAKVHIKFDQSPKALGYVWALVTSMMRNEDDLNLAERLLNDAIRHAEVECQKDVRYLKISSSYISHLIGKKGMTIKSLQEQAGCHIGIDVKDEGADEVNVKFGPGFPDQLDLAEKLVKEKIHEKEKNRELGQLTFLERKKIQEAERVANNNAVSMQNGIAAGCMGGGGMVAPRPLGGMGSAAPMGALPPMTQGIGGGCGMKGGGMKGGGDSWGDAWGNGGSDSWGDGGWGSGGGGGGAWGGKGNSGVWGGNDAWGGDAGWSGLGGCGMKGGMMGGCGMKGGMQGGIGGCGLKGGGIKGGGNATGHLPGCVCAACRNW